MIFKRVLGRYSEEGIMSSNMKDSGIEWIGGIPGDWNITTVKYVFSDSTITDRLQKWNKMVALYDTLFGGMNNEQEDEEF